MKNSAPQVVAGVIIALLALTMVIGVQAFDELAVHGGGEKAAIGGMALTLGIPWLGWLLLNWMPEERDKADYKRQLTAIGLTFQMFVGAALGIVAQAFLAWGLIFHVMPWIGLDLLAMARAVAAFDVPLRA